MTTKARKNFSLGIFGKLFLAFLLAALIPLLVTWYYARDRAIQDAEQFAQLLLDNHAARIASKVDSWSRLNRQSLIEHAATPAVVSMKPEVVRPVLVAMQQAQPWSYLVFAMAPDGMSIARSDKEAPINYADRGYFKSVMSGAPLGQQVLISRTNGKPAWILSVGIRDTSGSVLGVLAKGSSLAEITDSLVSESIGRTGKAMLLSNDGKLLAMTGATIGKELRDMKEHPAFVARRSDQRVIRFVDENRVPVIGRVITNDLGWSVVVYLTEAEVFAKVNQTNAYMATLLLAAALFATLFALVVAPTLARPIKRLTAITEEISRGNFAHEIKESRRGDEIGALARSIERMTRSLRIAMTRLSERRTS